MSNNLDPSSSNLDPSSSLKLQDIEAFLLIAAQALGIQNRQELLDALEHRREDLSQALPFPESDVESLCEIALGV